MRMKTFLIILFAPILAVAQVTVSYQVDASTDDAVETAAGSVSTTGTGAPIATKAQVNWGGARFLNVLIPQGATIVSATLTCVDTVAARVIDATIYCEAADNAATFSTASNNISGRTRTSNSVAWDVASTNTSGDVSPSLAASLQEVINRTGWVSGNSIVVILSIDTNGTAVSRSFNANPTKAAILQITYTTRRLRRSFSF
ncbi:MAG: hypothetical protein IT440_15580 [Phycisphaeraceae bacterium]|nr:hypothetical protein [Phycisphaeraceae bacterium]